MDFESLHTSPGAMEDYGEEYLFRRLSEEDNALYEQHLLICERCRSAVQKSDEFIRMFRRASDLGEVQ